ncbi:MAG: hypothetical protein JO079_07190 [Frankiaceae bacterium]|nr:hypothetical protein [Frankiaceae bacterium]
MSADNARGDFHGLIMVRDQPDVLDRSASAGTQAGCGDCVWEVVLACPDNLAGSSGDAAACRAAANAPNCKQGQQTYRLYLTTQAVTNRFEGALCLGSVDDVIPVGNIAAADVARYLRDVTPPDLVLITSPPRGTLVSLPTYFAVRPPPILQPAPFGGPQVHETITLTPSAYAWSWGDGTASDWTTDAGDRYPRGTLTHRYTQSGTAHGTLTTRWGGTYTITVAGRSFGPYDAIGTVTHEQPFALAVYTARSQLVSHA